MSIDRIWKTISGKRKRTCKTDRWSIPSRDAQSSENRRTNPTRRRHRYSLQSKTIDRWVWTVDQRFFNQDGLRFMDLIEQANRHVVNLFNSPTLADCKQAVDFFVNLRHYRLVLPNIEQSLRLMFSLIWSADKSICEAITQAFVKIYFDVAPTIAQA